MTIVIEMRRNKTQYWLVISRYLNSVEMMFLSYEDAAEFALKLVCEEVSA